MDDESRDKLSEALLHLKEPFDESKISYKPVPTKAQTAALKQDYKIGEKCYLCGGWHQSNVNHLEYVGHAATTDRLLRVDPFWNWDFLATQDNGLPLLDEKGCLWINLTVCGIVRKGYGDASGQSRSIGDNMKEMIGDAIRNAAMRFGVALDLWHKGDLYREDKEEIEAKTKAPVVDFFKNFTDAVNRNMADITEFKFKMDEENYETAAGIWYDFSEEDQHTLFLAPSKGGILTTKQREIMKSPEFTKVKR